MKKVFLLTLLFLSFSFSLSAQFNWQKLNGPSGGGYRVLPGKNGYIFTIYDGLYRSNNNGQSWEKMPAAPPGSWYKPVSVGADGNLYAGSGNQLYRSTDNGSTWNLLNNNIYYEAIFGLPGGEILVGDNTRILRSADNGQSWLAVAQNVNAGGGFAYNPGNGDIYAWPDVVTWNPSNLLRSSDNGQTWSVVLETTPFLPHQMAFSPTGAIFVGAEEVIWRSLDNGINWDTLNGFFQNSLSDISVAVGPTGRLFANESYKSRYSDDNGDTWYPVSDAVGNTLYEFSNDENGNVYARHDNGTIYVTVDNGVNWTFASNGIYGSTIVKLIHIDSEHLLALTLDGLFYSKNSGGTWEMIWDKVLLNGWTYNNRYLLATAPGGIWYLWDGNHILKFNNEGQSYVELDPPGLTANNAFLGIWCNPVSGAVFLSFDEDLYISEDAGQSWTQLADSPQSVFGSRAFLSDGGALDFEYEGIFRSDSDGQNRTKISNLNMGNANVFIGSGDEIYCLSGYTLFVSPDGGFTWDTTIFDFSYPLKDVVVNNSGQIFVYRFDNAVLRSVDGGHTFNPIDGPSQYGSQIGSVLSISPSQYLYMNQNNDGLYRSSVPTTRVKLLTGKVLQNMDGDCIYAQPDSLLNAYLVRVTQNNETSYGYSNSLGTYITVVDSGDYQISVVPPSDYWLSCNESIYIPGGGQVGVVDSADIGLNVHIDCPLAAVSVCIPFLRRCFERNAFIQYKNKGTIPATNAYLTITLDSLLEFTGASLPVSAQNGSSYTFQIGDLPVGATGGMTLLVKPSCSAPLGYIHCLKAHIYPDTLCPPLSGPQIVANAACLGDSVLLSIQNIGTGDMTLPLPWYVIDSDSVYEIASGNYFLSAGGSFSITIPSGAHELNFFAQQAPQYPFNTISHVMVQGCGAAPGTAVLNIINDDEMGPFTDMFCQRNIGSFDPNDKQGLPAGMTNKGYIEPDQTLSYIIRFQNTGTDTAFNVSIRDTLPVALDPGSIEVLNSSHACRLKMMSNGSLLFIFEHIMLPDSNINEATSHGFVQFHARQKANNPIGTTIRNQAAIYFDSNQPVLTNQTLHTVGIPITTSVNETTAAKSSVRVMPNPFTASFSVDVAPSVSAQVMRLFLYDNNGKIVAEKMFYSTSVTILRNNLPNGTYHFAIIDGEGNRVGSGTVVAE